MYLFIKIRLHTLITCEQHILRLTEVSLSGKGPSEWSLLRDACLRYFLRILDFLTIFSGETRFKIRRVDACLDHVKIEGK